jgi:hypothetical protein
MNPVRDHLISLGYLVNTRMVRARICQWNMQKNNQLRDMVAAIRLLDADPTLRPSPELTFLIKGRRVTLPEVLRFFRRKGIQDPFAYARSVVLDLGAVHVALLADSTCVANAAHLDR